MRLSLIHPTYGEIVMRYTPSSIRRSNSGGWKATPVVGQDDPMLTWSGGDGLTISFTAEFVGTSGAEQAEKLRLTCRRDAWKNASSPPRWQLYYGNRVIPVVVENCDLEDSVFDKKLNAMKVTASVSLRKWRQYAIVTRA